MEVEVRRAFLDRPHLVENAPGFLDLKVLTDSDDPSRFYLLTCGMQARPTGILISGSRGALNWTLLSHKSWS